MKTLHLRMEASQKSAMAIATFLESHDAVLKVTSNHFSTPSFSYEKIHNTALYSEQKIDTKT